MTKPDVDPTRLCQIEIVVTDMARSLRFYGEAFGWRAVPAEFHELVLLEVPEHCSFGISLRPGLVPRGRSLSDDQGLVLHFSVEDPQAILQRVETAGGRRIPTTLKLPGYGTVHLCEDPDGTRFGLFKRGSTRVTN